MSNNVTTDTHTNYDYYDFDLNKTRYQKCLCGAKNCRGYLGISTEENKKKLIEIR